MTDQAPRPAGPNELHPIRGGMDQEGFTDFRAKAPAQTAFEKHLQNTAFSEQQLAERDAKADAEALFGSEDEEPKTAFELEMRGGREVPLDAPESAQPSLFEPIQSDKSGLKVNPEALATVEKGSPTKPLPPKQPSTSPQSPGPAAPSAQATTTQMPSSQAEAKQPEPTKQKRSA